MSHLTDAAPLLEARELTKRYGSIQALDAVSFTAGSGITGILGPNGAGKSTAIRIFACATIPYPSLWSLGHC